MSTMEPPAMTGILICPNHGEIPEEEVCWDHHYQEDGPGGEIIEVYAICPFCGCELS